MVMQVHMLVRATHITHRAHLLRTRHGYPLLFPTKHFGRVRAFHLSPPGVFVLVASVVVINCLAEELCELAVGIRLRLQLLLHVVRLSLDLRYFTRSEGSLGWHFALDARMQVHAFN